MLFKPMLAVDWEPDKVNYPVLASYKMDGIRAVVLGNTLVSRNLKPIRNKHVQSLFGRKEYNGLDGELVCGNFQQTTHAVMSEHGEPNVEWKIFDDFSKGFDIPFFKRLEVLPVGGGLCPVPHVLCHNEEELMQYEIEALTAGCEGVMIRDPNGPYKPGRSTVKEGWLLKVKRFKDSEAIVAGVEERMHNANEAEKDNLGHTKRSLKNEGMVPTKTLGALVVYHPAFGEFKIGTGFTEEQRKDLWHQNIIGKLVKFKYQPTGIKDKPRFPVFLGFRDTSDL